MNDKFLYQLCEEPEPEFANNLRQKLTQPPFIKLAQDAKAGLFTSRYFTAKRMVSALVALSLAFALTLAVSPTVRAAVIDIIEKIIVKGTTVWVSDNVPAIKGESESYSIIWTPVHPGDISTNYPDFAKLPTWVPSGYVLQDRAALFGSMIQDNPNSVLFEWKNKHGDVIQLTVSKGSCPNGQVWESGEPRSDCMYGFYINVDSENQPEVITINEQSAILFPDLQILMDLSEPLQQWNPYRGKYDNRDPEAFFLIWESIGMRFEIATKSWTISKRDLIRLAESIP
jgi:hypothetical protein